jgi:uncharacterized Zn finger protein
MGKMSKYSCSSCGRFTTVEVPAVELGNLVSFGGKIPCSNCGKVGPKTYCGQA